MNNEQKAAMYEKLLLEHDNKAREVSLIKSKFDLTKSDEAEIDRLKKEMVEIQRKASSLGSL